MVDAFCIISTVHMLLPKLQAGVAEADAVILRMPLESLTTNDGDAQVRMTNTTMTMRLSIRLSIYCSVSKIGISVAHDELRMCRVALPSPALP